METKAKFFLLHVGVQEFVAQIVDQEDVVVLATENIDGKDVEYVKSIKNTFIAIKNIFQEVHDKASGKSQLQRMKGVLLTVNTGHVMNIAVVSKELQDKLNAAVVGLIV
jgi:phage terminase large subunit-like protein